LAGEGRIIERRRSPLSGIPPPLKQIKTQATQFAMFERGFTLKVSTIRLGLKVLPEGNKRESILYQPNANGTKKRELCNLRVEYIAHYKEGGHTGLLPPVWQLGEGKRRTVF